jgi:uncharacterized membrane protein YdjX (TVP38/TMEM64 family)
MVQSKLKKYLAFLKLCLLVGILSGLSFAVYRFFPDLVIIFQNLDSLNAYLEQYKAASVLIYIALQIIQVVISVIPGQILQFAAGYVYGFLIGTLLSLLGIALGTIITFYMARFLGKEAMHVLFGEERITKYINLLNSKRAYIILLVFFVIPGIPKDLLSYAAGVSEIKIKPFLLLSLVGRSPALMVTIAMSRMLYNGSYTELILLIAASILLFLIGILKREKLVIYTNALYERLVR